MVSFIALLGKCRVCKKPISIEYPLVELLTGFLFLWLYNKFGLDIQTFFYCALVSLLIIISFIDYHFYIIPDQLSIFGMVLGLIFSYVTHEISMTESLGALVAGGGFFFLLAFFYKLFFSKDGLGGGDIKLLAMFGSWFGYMGVVVTILVASCLGSVIGVGLILLFKRNKETALPFGPFLVIGALSYLFFKTFWVDRLILFFSN